jgi:4-hydroxy-4-methyl-2-oxoglutarate aldolase
MMITKASAMYERLTALQSDGVADVLDQMGLHDQIVSVEIQPLVPTMRVAGPAFCIRGEPAAGSTIEATAGRGKPSYELFRHMYDGCVAVVDTGGYRVAGPWGENTAVSARARGCLGVIVDGGTRDSLELAEMSFPTFVRFASAARVEGRWRHVEFEAPIELPGQVGSAVTVNPGDVIVADADGVVVVPRELGAEVAELGEELARIEEQMRRELADGVDREEVYRRHDRYAHIPKRANS